MADPPIFIDPPPVIPSDGSDIVHLGGGNDVFHALGGDDTISGGANRDNLYGGGGDDYLSGGSSNDKLYGGTGNDTLDGGGQDDRVYGGDGNDIIIGGNGNDVLYGDTASDANDAQGHADIFRFDDADGQDKVYDFEHGIDEVHLNNGASYALTYSGTNSILTYGTTTVVFYDEHLDASDITVL